MNLVGSAVSSYPSTPAPRSSCATLVTLSIRLLTVVTRHRRRGRGLGLVAAADLEDDLHVVAGAPSADAPVEIVLGRGADEVVIVAREELESAGLRRERPEGDGKVHRSARLVADRYYPRTRIRYPTGLVLLLGHLQKASKGGKEY